MTTLTEKQLKKEQKKEKLEILEGIDDDGKGEE
jgi:hypothetical protein